MIIDCHGHYTTTPKGVAKWREEQQRSLADPEFGDAPGDEFAVSDDEIRESLAGSQIALQRARGIDLTLFSPRASWMGHHIGNEEVSRQWTRRQNDLIRRVCDLYPENFAPVAQLPQSPGAPIKGSVRELRRCVEELGFVGCNVNPDPSGGHWGAPPLYDPYWWPLWEAMVELDVPGMIHVSASTIPSIHTTGSFYLNADTNALVQILSSGFTKQFPGLRLVVPHGGGAFPFHWGRFRGLAQDQGWDFSAILDHVWFDTCVYHQPGIDLLLDVVPTENVLFGSEMVGAVRGIDEATGNHWDDTGRYIENSSIGADDRRKIYQENTLRVYPRLTRLLEERR